MKRREFIALAAVGAAAGVVLPAKAASYSPVAARPRLLDILHDDEIVREIGRSYREMAPGENDARFLTEAILADGNGSVSAALGARLDQQVKQDFTLGRTVKINGWILSVTEAQQCALYSLQA